MVRTGSVLTLAQILGGNLHPYIKLGLLTVALLVGAIWAARLVRDLRGGGEGAGDTPEDLLTPLAQAFESGQMSEEEYHRIRASIERNTGDASRPTLPIRAASPSKKAPEPPAAD